ncbi:MAG: hypothetical protein NTU53_04720 [Planctomycetota bacterium]|nr:hypothetical protein [Planctomycetota bacterium]
MPDTEHRVLFSFDFIKNGFPSALYTLREWSAYVNPASNSRCKVKFAVSTSDTDANKQITVMRDYCRGSPLIVWDQAVNDTVLDLCKKEGLPAPVSSSFSYGGVVNKGLLLAAAHSCEYYVRIDPGTRPPSLGIDTILSQHAKYLEQHAESHAVVSRGYENRLALRDYLLKSNRVLDHHALVEGTTGIDVFNQVTGGAMFTSRVPGVPACPFEPLKNGAPTLVWASDDGFFQQEGSPNASRRLGGADIPRFDPEGKRKGPREYYRGIALAVWFSNYRKARDANGADAAVHTFIEQVKEFLDDEKCEKVCQETNPELHWLPEDFTADTVAPRGFRDQVRNGWNEYATLRECWPDLCTKIRDNVRDPTTCKVVTQLVFPNGSPHQSPP